MTTTIKPILKYPGAKWNCAEWIISHFPAHKHYVEPYFGSGAVFFKLPVRPQHAVLNDLSGDVVNLFRVLREQGEALAALVEMTPWAREEYEHSDDPTDDPLERARRFLVRVWQAHGGRVGIKPGWAHKSAEGNADTFERWTKLPRRILSVIEPLRFAEIERRDAVAVIKMQSSDKTLIYADPPYVHSTRADTGHYQHEMTDADHSALLDALDAHPGPVVLSGYHCQLYDDRLRHWHTREKKVQAEKGNTRTEVLWLNPVCIERLGYGPLFSGGPLPSAEEGNG